MNTYTLHGYFRSSTSWRVRIALGLKGVPYESRGVHLLRDGGEQKTEAYRAMNPIGEVPTLEIRGEDGEPMAHLAQSVAILEYLEETHPNPPLLPTDPILRAQTRQLVEVVNSSIHPVQNLKVMRTLTADFGTDRAANFDWARRWIERHFVGLETLITRVAGTHAVGDTITLADVVIIPQVFNAIRFGVDMTPFPRLAAVDAAVSGHPAFVAALPENQPDFE
jgi:maleylpyruvate isomerase